MMVNCTMLFCWIGLRGKTINNHSNLFTSNNKSIAECTFDAMNFQSPIFRFFKNKYVLAVLFLATWLLFFDKNDLFTQLDRRQQVKKLERERDYYTSEIERSKQEIKELQSNPRMLEKFAREHYLMKRDNEDVYIIVTDSVGKK
jgi:cell division protein DivIC